MNKRVSCQAPFYVNYDFLADYIDPKFLEHDELFFYPNRQNSDSYY